MNIKKIMKFYLNKEFLLFLLVGGINTFSGVGFSFVYSEILNPNSAFVGGYCTSLILSYILNSRITFKSNLEFARFVKFAVSYVPNFIIQNFVVFLVYNQLNYDKLVAYIAAAMLGIPITFLCMKLFAFKKSDKEKQNDEEEREK